LVVYVDGVLPRQLEMLFTHDPGTESVILGKTIGFLQSTSDATTGPKSSVRLFLFFENVELIRSSDSFQVEVGQPVVTREVHFRSVEEYQASLFCSIDC